MKLDDKTIDIVLPYVNPMDKSWQADFKKCKALAGDKGDNRFRDAGTLRHWFRLVRKNVKFKYRVVLILAKESQVPAWLKKDMHDVKIVFHRDFIPATELPTFNSSVINCYIPFIKGLHERYILFNDDIFIVKPTYEGDWFDDSRPKFHVDWVFYPRSGKLWDLNIGKCQDIVNALMHTQVHIVPEHGPLPHLRTVDLFLWDLIGPKMTDALAKSQFRTKNNITDWIFSMFYIVADFASVNRSPISTYYNTESLTIPSTKMVCYNDTELIKDYPRYKAKLHSLLKSV